MKKLFLSSCLVAGLVSSVAAIDIGIVEISPEVGLAISSKSSTYTNGTSSGPSVNGTYGGYARLWVGVFGFVVAPQASVHYIGDSGEHSRKFVQPTYLPDGAFNYQYGLSFGKNFGLAVVRLTPYVGFNRSSYGKIDFDGAEKGAAKYSHATAYQVGLKVKPTLIPLAVSLQYAYQNPDVLVSNVKTGAITMHDITLLVGLHF